MSATKIDKMVIAAVRLAEEGKDPFSAEDLVVKAFELYPADFCLPGYPSYPNSNAIYTKIMGKSSPLVSKGFLQKSGTQRFRATSAAKARARELGEVEGATHTVTGRQEAVELANLFTSAAWQLYREGRQVDITFYQACRFFNVPARASQWQAIAGRLAEVGNLVDRAVKLGEDGEDLHLPVRGRDSVFKAAELRELGPFRDLLLARFDGELKEWRARLDRS